MKSTGFLGRVSRFAECFPVTILKTVSPIIIVSLSPLYTLLMLLAFGWLGRMVLAGSLALGTFLSARHVYGHHSLKHGGTVSDQERQEARDYILRLFREVNVCS